MLKKISYATSNETITVIPRTVQDQDGTEKIGYITIYCGSNKIHVSMENLSEFIEVLQAVEKDLLK